MWQAFENIQCGAPQSDLDNMIGKRYESDKNRANKLNSKIQLVNFDLITHKSIKYMRAMWISLRLHMVGTPLSVEPPTKFPERGDKIWNLWPDLNF